MIFGTLPLLYQRAQNTVGAVDSQTSVHLLSDYVLQNLSGSNIGEDASNVRNNLRLLAATELPVESREAGRTEVLPVQWRKHLRLNASAPARNLCHDSIA